MSPEPTWWEILGGFGVLLVMVGAAAFAFLMFPWWLLTLMIGLAVGGIGVWLVFMIGFAKAMCR